MRYKSKGELFLDLITMVEALKHIMKVEACDLKAALRDILRAVEDRAVKTWWERGRGHVTNGVAFCEDARFRLGERGTPLLKALEVAWETGGSDQGPSIFEKDFDFGRDFDDVIPQAPPDPGKRVENFQDLIIID